MYLGLRKEGSAGVDEELKTCMGVKQKKKALVDMDATTEGGDLRVHFLTIHMAVDNSWR